MLSLLCTRDGPKFGERRSSAEQFGRMFGSVRLGNMWLFGRSSAELRQKFGVTCGFALTVFCGPAGVNLNPLPIISYQLITNFPVGIQLLDDDDVQWFNVHIKAD